MNDSFVAKPEPNVEAQNIRHLRERRLCQVVPTHDARVVCSPSLAAMACRGRAHGGGEGKKQYPGVGSHDPLTQEPQAQSASFLQERCTQPCRSAPVVPGRQSQSTGHE